MLEIVSEEALVQSEKYRFYQQKCDLILDFPEIRFVGLLDEMGNQVAGGFREDV